MLLKWISVRIFVVNAGELLYASKKRRNTQMDEKEIRQRIQAGRDFMKHYAENDESYVTDQYAGVTQPPLFKDPVATPVPLPQNYEDLVRTGDILEVINRRESNRIYTEENITLLQLSYILWCAQGVKGLRGKKYATLRTVPCGGARHEFELYMCIKNVEGLKPGYYHYLPQSHSVECLREEENLKDFLDASLCGQTWSQKSSVVFYFSIIPYRAEWRYGIYTHRIALVDAGYISENIYLACTSIGLGSCALGAIVTEVCDEAFGLDGNDEFIFLAHTVGTIQEADRQKELDLYSFVHENDL